MSERYFEIDDSDKKYSLDKMSVRSEEYLQLWTKHFLMFQHFAQYWGSRLEMGKKCQRYMRRDIFTPGQRKKYLYIEDKWPIEPPILKPIIRDMSNLIKQSVPGYAIEMEDSSPPPNAAKPEVVNTTLKWLANKIKLDRRKDGALREGMITGYPSWVWFSRGRGVAGMPGPLECSLPPWDSMLCTPAFLEPDGSDIKEVIRLSRRTKAELLAAHPERKKQHEQHTAANREDPGYISQLLNVESHKYDSESIKDIFFDMMMSLELDDSEGSYLVLEHFYPVAKEREIFINEETFDSVTLPDEWKDERKEFWKQQHPEYSLVKSDEVNTLWLTSIDSTGFIWDNDAHWYQDKGSLPGCVYIPDMVDKIPVGGAEDLLPYVLMDAAAETEALAEVRKGTGKTTFIEEGAAKQPRTMRTEMNRPDGVVVMRKGNNPKQTVHVVERKPNETFHLVADRTEEKINRYSRINPSIQGFAGARQSDKARQTDIAQAAASQGLFVDNFTIFNHEIARKLCSFFPYVLTEETVVSIEDEYGNKEGPHVVNESGFDYSGQAQIIANDLTVARYNIVPVASDDSATSRESQMMQFANILEAIGNTLLQLNPRFLAKFLGSLPNRYAREAGKFMAEEAERMEQSQAQSAQMEAQADAKKSQDRKEIEEMKLMVPKTAFKLDPKEIQEAPMGAMAMMELLNNQIKTHKMANAPQMQGAQQMGNVQQPAGVPGQQ
jgi:hypothetical protein